MCTPAAPAFRHGLSMSTLRWLVSLQPRQSNSISLRNRNINRSSIRNTISGGAVNFNSSGVARAAAPGPCIQPNFGAYAGLLGRRGYATASSPCHDGALREAFDSNVLDSNLHARSPPTTSANHGLLLRKEFQSMASFAQLVDDVRIAGDDIVRRISELPSGDVRERVVRVFLATWLVCAAVPELESIGTLGLRHALVRHRIRVLCPQLRTALGLRLLVLLFCATAPVSSPLWPTPCSTESACSTPYSLTPPPPHPFPTIIILPCISLLPSSFWWPDG